MCETTMSMEKHHTNVPLDALDGDDDDDDDENSNSGLVFLLHLPRRNL